MKVFISWSGQRSAAVADALRYWLPKVIQALEPWMSADDVDKGTRWRSGIADELEKSSVGIICLHARELRLDVDSLRGGSTLKATTEHLRLYVPI